MGRATPNFSDATVMLDFPNINTTTTTTRHRFCALYQEPVAIIRKLCLFIETSTPFTLDSFYRPISFFPLSCSHTTLPNFRPFTPRRRSSITSREPTGTARPPWPHLIESLCSTLLTSIDQFSSHPSSPRDSSHHQKRSSTCHDPHKTRIRRPRSTITLLFKDPMISC